MKNRQRNRIALRLSLLATVFALLLTALLLVQNFAPLENGGQGSVAGPDTNVTDTVSQTTETSSGVSTDTGTVTDTVTTNTTTNTIPPNTDPPVVPEPDVDPQTEKALAEQLLSKIKYNAKHIVVYDLTLGLTLYEKDAQATITAASTTKLLTTLVALDYADETTRFTVGSELSLVGKNSSTAKLKTGYVLTLEQILDALLIPSGNDAAYVIAAHVGRIIANDPQISDKAAVALFVEKMNEKAKLLGAQNSLFSCPDGYPDKTQYTTAADMMIIAIHAAKNDTVLNTVSKTYVLHKLPNGATLEFTTTNKLILPSSSYYYEDTFGMKTGYTGAAGQCFIGGATAYGHKILVAVYNSDTDSGRWKDCRNAFDAAASAIKQARAAFKSAT